MRRPYSGSNIRPSASTTSIQLIQRSDKTYVHLGHIRPYIGRSNDSCWFFQPESVDRINWAAATRSRTVRNGSIGTWPSNRSRFLKNSSDNISILVDCRELSNSNERSSGSTTYETALSTTSSRINFESRSVTEVSSGSHRTIGY